MSLEQAIQDARRILNVDPIIARLGDGNGNVYDLVFTGYYFCRKIESDNKLSKPFSLPLNPLASIPPRDGQPVILGYDSFGIFCIYSANRLGMISGNTNPLILNPLDTAVYGKTSQTNLATLYYQRHGDTVNFPFTVVVFKAPVIINGVADLFAGAGINIASFVPAAGIHCYVSIFLRTDMTVGVDIQEGIDQSSANSVIICAWELHGGDTALSPSPARNVDMRQIVNTGSGSSPGTSLTVTDGTTTVTDVTEIDFNGTDFTVTDLTGGAVQIDLVTPSAQIFPVTCTGWFDEVSVTSGDPKESSWDANQQYAIWTRLATAGVSHNGNQFTIPFLLAAGTYTFNVLGITYNGNGIMTWEWSDDGITWNTIVTGQDWYTAGPVYGVVKSVASIVISTNGNHILRSTITGTSAAGYAALLTKFWWV